MATAVTKTTGVINAGTALTETSLATCTGTAGFAIAGVDDCSKFVLYVENTSTHTQTMTINASDEFTAKGQGDITLSLAQNTPQVLTVEAARIRQADGSITGTITDSATGATGVIGALDLP